MNIHILGRLDGWMGVHMRQYANGFAQLAHHVELLDYHDFCQKKFLLHKLIGRKQHAQIAERTLQLGRCLRTQAPDVLIFTGANLKFDFAQLRTFSAAKLIYVDMDGPAASYFTGDLTWIDAFDVLATVSKATYRTLQAAGFAQTIYLPHGVDTDYYTPMTLTAEQQTRFSAAIAFVGRTSKRRVAHVEPLAEHGLVVWGKRWSQKPYRDHPALQACVRETDNVIGEEVNALYNASTTVLNILQRDAFREQNTILSLQVFAVPAAESCLITEWVEELSDAFEIGREVLAFKSAEELAEIAIRTSRDKQAARQIAERGRARCLAAHTHRHRALRLLRYL